MFLTRLHIGTSKINQNKHIEERIRRRLDDVVVATIDSTYFLVASVQHDITAPLCCPYDSVSGSM